MAAVVAGCGGGDDVGTRPAEGTFRPSGGMVVAALVTDEYGWVLTWDGGSGVAITVVDPSGETKEVGRARGSTVRAATNGSDLFVLASVCDDGEEECDRGRTLLSVVDADGVVVDGIEVDRPTDVGSSGGGTIVGVAGRDAWITTGTELARVSPAGEVVEDAGFGGGLPCVVDGRLFATSSPPAPGGSSGGGVEPGAAVGGPGVASDDGVAQPDPGSISSEDAIPVDLTVAELVDGTWVDVEGATIPLAPTADLACTPVGIERYDHATGAAVPDAVWTPDGGLVPVRAVDAAALRLQGPALPTPHGEQYLTDGDGRLLVRAPGSASFALRPGAGRDELRATSMPTYDASATLEIWCGTPAGDGPARPVCRMSRR
jgi:hypothetical protein